MQDRKTLLLVGATSDIGCATALRYAEAGWRVLLAARNGEAAQREADDIATRTGAEVGVHRLDILETQSFPAFAISRSFCPYRAGSRGPLSLASPLRASRLPPPQRAAYLRAVRADRSGARRRHGYGGVDARSGRVRRYGDRLPPGIGGRAHRTASTPLRARRSAKLPGRRGRRPGGARWRTRRPDRRQRRLHAS